MSSQTLTRSLRVLTSVAFLLSAALAVAGALLVFGAPALASPILVVTNDTTTQDTASDIRAWAFTVGSQSVTIEAIGVYDSGQDGIAAGTNADRNHTNWWAIWDNSWKYSTSHRLYEVQIPSSGGTLTGDTRFFNLGTQITLNANTQYVVGVYFSNTANKTLRKSIPANDATAPSGVTEDNNSSKIASFNFKTFNGPYMSGHYDYDGGNEWFAGDSSAAFPTASFSLTPEPATMALLALGGVGMLMIRRRRSK